MAKKIISLFALAVILTGCGAQSATTSAINQINPFNPPAVHAAPPPPVNCDGGGACTASITHTWGYCQYSTYQTAQTFTFALEIGIASTPTDPNDSLCYVPFALSGGIIKTINGNTNYVPWTANLSSMFLDIRACTQVGCPYPAGQEHLASQKYMVKGAPQSLPLSGTYATGINTNGFMIVFNDDLQAKPTTISVAFSGTFQ